MRTVILVAVFFVGVLADCNFSSCSDCLLGTVVENLDLRNDTFCYWCPSSNTCKEHATNATISCPDFMIEPKCPELQCGFQHISVSPYTCTWQGKVSFGLNFFSFFTLVIVGISTFVFYREWKKRLEEHQNTTSLLEAACETCCCEVPVGRKFCPDCILYNGVTTQEFPFLVGIGSMGIVSWIFTTLPIAMLSFAAISAFMVLVKVIVIVVKLFQSQAVANSRYANLDEEQSFISKSTMTIPTASSASKKISALQSDIFQYAIRRELQTDEHVLWAKEATPHKQAIRFAFLMMCFMVLFIGSGVVILVVEIGWNLYSRLFFNMLPMMLALVFFPEWAPVQCYVLTNRRVLLLKLSKKTIETSKMDLSSLKFTSFNMEIPDHVSVDDRFDIFLPENARKLGIFHSVHFSSASELPLSAKHQKPDENLTFLELNLDDVSLWRQILENENMRFNFAASSKQKVVRAKYFKYFFYGMYGMMSLLAAGFGIYMLVAIRGVMGIWGGIFMLLFTPFAFYGGFLVGKTVGENLIPRFVYKKL